MIKNKDRFLIFLSSYFWAILGLLITGSFIFFLIPLSAFIYLIVGGIKNV
jgi:hypothetical protein